LEVEIRKAARIHRSPETAGIAMPPALRTEAAARAAVERREPGRSSSTGEKGCGCRGQPGDQRAGRRVEEEVVAGRHDHEQHEQGVEAASSRTSRRRLWRSRLAAMTSA